MMWKKIAALTPCMNAARVTVALLLSLGLTVTAKGAIPPAAERVTVEQHRAEIVALADNLRTLHPQPFASLSEAAFVALTDRLVAGVDEQTSRRDMLWAYSELAASIGCGHTSLGFFNQEDALIPAAARFPVDVTFVDGRLLVVDPLVNGTLLSKGDEITAINGRPADALVAEALRHISSDAHNPHYRTGLFRLYATSYLTYAAGFPERYSVTVAGNPVPLELTALDKFQHRPVLSSRAICQETLCLDRPVDGVALMTIRSWAFYGDRQPIFRKYIDESLASLREEAPKALIIDIRNNLGGSGFAAAYLLRHLVQTEFGYFHPDSSGAEMLKRPLAPIETGWSGTVIVLSDELTHSTSGHFLSLVKAHGAALIVGRASGAGSEVHDNSKSFVSQYSGIEYKIATSTFSTDTPGCPASASVAPDVLVPLTPDAVLADQDAILEFALSLVAAEGIQPT